MTEKELLLLGAEEAIRSVARTLADNATGFSDESEIFEESDAAVAIQDLVNSMADMTMAINHYRKIKADQ